MLLEVREKAWSLMVLNEDTVMIEPKASFKDNLDLMGSIDGVAYIDIIDPKGTVADTIENQPGKQGSLVVYQYLKQNFEILDAKAAAHGLAVFAEHTDDARNRPGAHPNIDRLFAIVEGGDALTIRVVEA